MKRVENFTFKYIHEHFKSLTFKGHRHGDDHFIRAATKLKRDKTIIKEHVIYGLFSGIFWCHIGYDIHYDLQDMFKVKSLSLKGTHYKFLTLVAKRTANFIFEGHYNHIYKILKKQ